MKMLDSHLVTLIAGPTASGKSAFALKLAKENNGIIVNADSMQIYEDLRILSARPSLEEETQVTHKLYGFVQAKQEFSVGLYIENVKPLLEEARKTKKHLFFVGGTGLYFRSLIEGLMPTPKIPQEISEFWEKRAIEGFDLYKELEKRDKLRAEQLHPNDIPRILRAIELHDATDKNYSSWLLENKGEALLQDDEYKAYFISPPIEQIKDQINNRFLKMIEQGALQEVEKLLQENPQLPTNRGILKAHGIPHLSAYIEGRIMLNEAIEKAQADTRAYARRQVIFARKYLCAPKWNWLQNPDIIN